MNLRNIEFLVQEAFTGIVRNGLMAFASITTIALSLGVLGAFVLVSLGANHFAAAQINQFEIAVFVKNTQTNKVDKIAQDIREMRGVASVTIKDRNKEWAEFKRSRPDIEAAGLPTNPLPFPLVVKIKDHARQPQIASSIREMDGIDAVKEYRDTLNHVMAIAQVIKGVSIAGVLVLLVTAIFIISNAIKLTLYARRREIRIMQLVGATNWFIRIPLIIEGIVFGASGAFIAWLLLLAGGAYMTHAASRILPLLSQFGTGITGGQLAVSLVTLGAAIGAAGSFVSIRRFLHD